MIYMHYFVLCQILVSLHHGDASVIEKNIHCECVLGVIFSVRNVKLCLASRLTNISELNGVWFD